MDVADVPDHEPDGLLDDDDHDHEIDGTLPDGVLTLPASSSSSPSLPDVATHTTSDTSADGVVAAIVVTKPKHARLTKLTACQICSSHKVKCDGQRPCVRCVRLNRPHQCVDRIPGAKASTRKHKPMVISTITAPPRRRRRKPTATTTATATTTPDTSSPSAASSSSPPPSSSSSTRTRIKRVPSSQSQSSSSSSSSVDAIIAPSSSPTSTTTMPSCISSSIGVDAAPTITDIMLYPSSSSSSPSSSSLSSSFIVRSASRSPARKKERRSDHHTREEKYDSKSNTTTDIVTYVSGSHDRATMSSLSSIPSIIRLWNDAKVYRRSMAQLLPWLIDHMTYHYNPDTIGYDWCEQALHWEVPRVCINCTSPSSPCVACSQPLITPPAKRLFSEYFSHAFINSVWSRRTIYWSPSNVLETEVSIAACIESYTPGPYAIPYRVDTTELYAQHHRAISSLTAQGLLKQMAVAMMQQQSSFTSPPSPPSCVDSKGDSGNQLPDTKEIARQPSPSALALVDPSSSSKLPTDAFSSMITVNGAMERLIGYSKTELMQRMASLGWKLDIRLSGANETSQLMREQFLCLVGMKSQYAMMGHIVTKYNVIVKCLIFGSCVLHPSGYRTLLTFFVPLPSPLSTDPFDPIWDTM